MGKGRHGMADPLIVWLNGIKNEGQLRIKNGTHPISIIRGTPGIFYMPGSMAMFLSNDPWKFKITI